MHTEKEKHAFEPKIIAFVCTWCTYAGADLAGTSRMQYPANVRVLKFPCTGRIDPVFILKAFQQGADGVLVSGCHPGDCHYVEQNYKTIRRQAMLQYFLERMGIETDRLRLVWASAAEGQVLAESIDKFVADVRRLGPLAWPEKWAENGLREEALAQIVHEHAEAMEVQA